MERLFLLFLNFLIGLGAFVGSCLAFSPTAQRTAGVTLEMLKNSPFTSFFIPGLFLFFVLSCGNFIVGFISLKKQPYFPYYQTLIGAMLFLWLTIQCLALQAIVLLHVLFFFLSLIQIALGVKMIKTTHLSPPFSAHQN